MSMNQNLIRDEAKKIMDNFLSSMKDIEVEENFNFVAQKCCREESDGMDVDSDFRERFISNAPKSKGYAILANKGAWVEK